jgi:hypothetical protein
MMLDSTDHLARLLDRVSHRLSMQEFKDGISDFWEREIAERKLLPQINFKKGPCKKLMDEVMSVFLFLKLKNINTGFIRFPLNNKIPDCFLWQADSEVPQGIEVTIAQRRARFHLMREIVEKGSGRGFVDLQDDAGAHEFERALESEPECYTTEQALNSTKRAISLCLNKKNHSKYASMDLLIQGPLSVSTLPRERWRAIKGDLIEAAKSMPFRGIHVIGDDSEQPIGFRIK